MTISMNIKDYLHLYLGCEATDGFAITGALTEVSIDTFGESCVIGMNGMSYRFTVDAIKPILRPLSEMTAEERKTWANVRFPDNTRLEPIQWEAESVRYLLSRQFDLFGLIEAGLAIDKTKEHGVTPEHKP